MRLGCLLVLVSSLIFGGVTLLSAASTESSRLENGCPARSGLSAREWVCFTLDEEANRQMKELDLESLIVDVKLDLARARAKRLKRLGWSLGPGFGIGIGGKDNGGFEPDLGLYLSYGFRF
jgi:hypothetical protein